jgi:UDP-N-acetylmuramoylalanine--D-glutamate ligase
LAFEIRGKKVTVAGAARSGIAAAELLASRGAVVTLSDARADVPSADSLKARGVQLELGGHHTATFADADLVVLSPGVPAEQPAIAAARANNVPVMAEIELASR